MKKLLSLLSLSVLLLVSCSKSSDTTSQNNTTVTPANTMTTAVDGVGFTWAASGSTFFLPFPLPTTITTVTGQETSGAKGISLTLTNVTAAGTYAIGKGSVSLVYHFTDNAGAKTLYNSPAQDSVGKIIITELTSTSCKATFEATVTKSSGPAASPATALITNGSVNATIH